MITKYGRISRTVCCIGLSGVAACNSQNLVCPTGATVGLTLLVLDATDRRNLEADARVTISSLEINPVSLTGTPKDAVRITISPGRYALNVVAGGYRSVSDTVKLEQSSGTCPSIVPLTKELLLSRTQQ